MFILFWPYDYVTDFWDTTLDAESLLHRLEKCFGDGEILIFVRSFGFLERSAVEVPSVHDPKPKPFKEGPIVFLKKDVHALWVELAAGLQGLLHEPFPHPPFLELGVDTHAVNQKIAPGASDHGQEANQLAIRPGAEVESVLLENLFVVPLRRPPHCMTEGD